MGEALIVQQTPVLRVDQVVAVVHRPQVEQELLVKEAQAELVELLLVVAAAVQAL